MLILAVMAVLFLVLVFYPVFKITWGIAKKIITFAFKAALVGIVLFLVISLLVALI